MLEYAVSEGIVDTDREKIFGDDRPRMSAVSVLMKNSEIAAKKQQARLDQRWKDKAMALRHVEHDGFGAPPDAPPKPDPALLLAEEVPTSRPTSPKKSASIVRSGRRNCKIHATRRTPTPPRACSCAELEPRGSGTAVSPEEIQERLEKSVSRRYCQERSASSRRWSRSTPSTGCCLPKWAMQLYHEPNAH